MWADFLNGFMFGGFATFAILLFCLSERRPLLILARNETALKIGVMAIAAGILINSMFWPGLVFSVFVGNWSVRGPYEKHDFKP